MVKEDDRQDSLLFKPIQFGNVTSKNRICIAPMCQYSCEDGFAADWHLVHLGARAIGGAGIVMVEATAVEPRGRISPSCVGLWKDEHVEPLSRICTFLKSQGSVPAIQLAHSGRKGSTLPPWKGRANVPKDKGGWDVIGPSAIPFNDRYAVPKEATVEEIQSIRQAFVDAAKRAIKAGFEIIELHFAHGYLVQSFLSPHSNKRLDKYGGSFEGRTRLAIELVKDVKAILPDGYPLFVRISATEFLPKGEGWDIEDSVKFSVILKKLGVDLVDCSAGGNVDTTKFFVYNNVDQISMSERVHREAEVPTGAVGGIVNPVWAEEILKQNKATIILIARASMYNPNWPYHAACQLNALHQFKLTSQYFWMDSQLPNGKCWRTQVMEDGNQKQLAGEKIDE